MHNQNHGIDDKNCDCLNGVCCHVENCVFHTTGDRCDAPEINVGNDRAKNKDETYCGTFNPKDGCCH